MDGRIDGRVEKGKATRQRLVVAARALFGEHGYDGTSVSAVLEAAGVARGALYHHFATKEALFDAVLDREVAAVARAAAEAAVRAADALESLRAGCRAWLQLAVDPAVQRIVLIDAPAVVGWARWRELDEKHTLGGLRASIARLAGEGRVSAGQADVLANIVLASVGEVAMMIAQADDPQAALAEGQAAVDTLLDRLFS